MRATKVLTVTLSPAMWRDAERAARRKNKSKSELVREALRRYLDDQEWASLREYGSRKVAELGIQEADVERLIHEFRQDRRREASRLRTRG